MLSLHVEPCLLRLYLDPVVMRVPTPLAGINIAGRSPRRAKSASTRSEWRCPSGGSICRRIMRATQPGRSSREPGSLVSGVSVLGTTAGRRGAQQARRAQSPRSGGIPVRNQGDGARARVSFPAPEFLYLFRKNTPDSRLRSRPGRVAAAGRRDPHRALAPPCVPSRPHGR